MTVMIEGTDREGFRDYEIGEQALMEFHNEKLFLGVETGDYRMSFGELRARIGGSNNFLQDLGKVIRDKGMPHSQVVEAMKKLAESDGIPSQAEFFGEINGEDFLPDFSEFFRDVKDDFFGFIDDTGEKLSEVGSKVADAGKGFVNTYTDFVQKTALTGGALLIIGIAAYGFATSYGKAKATS